MYSRLPFPVSMENLPRQNGFCCLSLKCGTVFTAVLVILYTVLGLAQCGALLSYSPQHLVPGDYSNKMIYTVVIAQAIVYTITFTLTAVMLVGALRESYNLLRPWLIWFSVQIMASIWVFVYSSATSFISHPSDNSLIVYIVQFVMLMIRVYMLMLVASYYRQLEEQIDETERLKKLIDRETWYTVA